MLQDQSADSSPLSGSLLQHQPLTTFPFSSSSLLRPNLAHTSQHARMAGRTFLCFMMVVCFLVNPFSLSSSSHVAGVHGSQRTLSWFDEGSAELSWLDIATATGVWGLRLFAAAVCFGVVWYYSLPRLNEQEKVKYWRLRKQAEQDIKKVSYGFRYKSVSDYTLPSSIKGALSSAETRLLQALAEVGFTFPSSYAMLLLSLAWHAICHTLFQVPRPTCRSLVG